MYMAFYQSQVCLLWYDTTDRREGGEEEGREWRRQKEQTKGEEEGERKGGRQEFRGDGRIDRCIEINRVIWYDNLHDYTTKVGWFDFGCPDKYNKSTYGRFENCAQILARKWNKMLLAIVYGVYIILSRAKASQTLAQSNLKCGSQSEHVWARP